MKAKAAERTKRKHRSMETQLMLGTGHSTSSRVGSTPVDYRNSTHIGAWAYR